MLYDTSTANVVHTNVLTNPGEHEFNLYVSVNTLSPDIRHRYNISTTKDHFAKLAFPSAKMTRMNKHKMAKEILSHAVQVPLLPEQDRASKLSQVAHMCIDNFDGRWVFITATRDEEGCHQDMLVCDAKEDWLQLIDDDVAGKELDPPPFKPTMLVSNIGIYVLPNTDVRVTLALAKDVMDGEPEEPIEYWFLPLNEENLKAYKSTANSNWQGVSGLSNDHPEKISYKLMRNACYKDDPVYIDGDWAIVTLLRHFLDKFEKSEVLPSTFFNLAMHTEVVKEAA